MSTASESVAQQPGLLLVYTDPGELVAEEEFTDWYDNEHIPLRVAVPAFQSWHRWVAPDDKHPRWAASYDLTSTAATRAPPYTDLMKTQSPREKRLFRDVAVLDRRTYEQLPAGPTIPPPSALYDAAKPPAYSVFVSVDVSAEGDAEYNRWYDEEHIPMLAKCPGWIRSRRFVLQDWSQAGVQGQQGQSAPPKYLAVHEWAGLDMIESEEHKAASSTPWKAQVGKSITRYDLRLMKHYRSWERK